VAILHHLSREETAAARGGVLGAAAREQIGVTIAVYERLLQEDVGLGRRDMARLGARVGHMLRGTRPALAGEIEAIAEGAAQSPELLFAVNARTELLAGGRVATGGSARRCPQECSVVGCAGAAPHVLLGQTWDFHPSLEDARLLWIAEQPDGTWWATFTEAGLVAKTGMNSSGLALALSFLSSPADGGVNGLPVHVLARCILEDCRSVEDVASLLRRSPRSASVCFSVAAANGTSREHAASFEVAPTGVVAVPPDARGFLAHTNHMVGEPAREDDPLHENSVGRLTELSRRLGAVDPRAVAVEQLAEVLSVDRGSGFPIFRRVDPAAPWLERTATLATLLYDVTAKRLWLRSGLDAGDDLTEVALPGREPDASPA